MIVTLITEAALLIVAAQAGFLDGPRVLSSMSLDSWAPHRLSHLSDRYHVGLYRRGDAVLYVHPGLGTTGPPVRLGVAPAVTIITLRAA